MLLTSIEVEVDYLIMVSALSFNPLVHSLVHVHVGRMNNGVSSVFRVYKKLRVIC